MADEPDLRARIYWTVAVAATLVMALLLWLTETFNIRMGSHG